MPASQIHITPQTRSGANLVPGGATFRVFGPAALNVWVLGDFNAWTQKDPATLLTKKDNYWTGFIPGIVDGSLYKFFVEGEAATRHKRDPYAREIAPENKNCVVRDPGTYPWHDAGFRPPAFNDLIIYQFHVGTYFGRDDAGEDNRKGRDCTFLDVLDRLEYLSGLGVNALEPLPVNEFETDTSQGYNGSDLFAPEFRYTIPKGDPRLTRFLATANRLLAAKHKSPLTMDQLARPINQLKALVDLCHVYGIAVLFDVVYNHAGGFEGDDESIFFWDLQKGGNNNSLYFTDVPDGSGGLIFAYWNADIRQFLIDNAAYFLREMHVDGFRFDQVTIIDQNGGHQFCRDLTDTLKFIAPDGPLIAEYWADQSSAVKDTGQGGSGSTPSGRPGSGIPSGGPSARRRPAQAGRSRSTRWPPPSSGPRTSRRSGNPSRPSRTTTRFSPAGVRASLASPTGTTRGRGTPGAGRESRRASSSPRPGFPSSSKGRSSSKTSPGTTATPTS